MSTLIDVSVIKKSLAIEFSKILEKKNKLSLIDFDNPKVVGSIQTIFGLKFELEQQSIFDIIIRNALECEKKIPGAFLRMIDIVIKTFQKHDIDFEIIKLQNELDLVKQHKKIPLTKDYFFDVLKTQFSSSEYYELIRDVIEHLGLVGNVAIEKTKNKLHVEFINSNVFNAKKAININDVTLVKPYVAIIDGYIESVSEIHNLLNDVFESKSQLALITRGMSNDVLNTLSVNWHRGLIVAPLIVDFDLEGINTLVDIAVVTNNNVISSNKGDLISTCRLTTFQQVEKIEISNGKLLINSITNEKKLARHIQQLVEKKKTCDDDSFMRLYDLRIKALNSHQAVIRIPDDMNFVNISQQFDNALRMIKLLTTHGAYENNDSLLTMISLHHAIKVLKFLQDVGYVLI